MKYVITHAVALAVGVTAGYFYANKTLKAKYEEIAQEEIDSVKQVFYPHLEDCDADDDREDGIGPGMESDFEEPEPTQSSHNPYSSITRSSLDLRNVKSEQAKQHYSLAFNKKDEDEEEESDPPEEPTLDDISGEPDTSEPYLISDAEYTNECESYEKRSLYYYLGDDVLCDEDDNPMDDAESAVGTDWSGDLSSVRPCVWVRNDALKIDYEICAVNANYTQTVCKTTSYENLSPRERYNRTHSRRDTDE